MMSPPDDVSITATDATVAGSSVAATEAYDDDDDDDDDEINVCPAPSPPAGPDDDGASPPATLTIANNPPPTPSSAASSTPPGHLLDQARGLHTGHSHHHTPESIDPDILLDGMGLRDLDACATMEGVQELLRMHHHSNSHHLPALNERMSEEEIYDEGAFRDLQYAAKATAAAAGGGTSSPSGGGDGGGGGVGGGDSPPKTSHSLRGSVISGASVRSLQLNTLDEEEEDLEDDDDPTILNGAIPPGVEVPSSIMEELIASEERRKSFDCDEPGDDDEGAASQVDLADDAEILR